MSEITNIESLRNHAIETLHKLRMHSIDIEEAKTTSNLYENIISTLKSELEYNKFMKSDKTIPFLEGSSGQEGIRTLNSKRLGEDVRNLEDHS